MNGNGLILLGLGISTLYIYFCISTHKDQLYKKLYPTTVSTTTEVKTNTTVKEKPKKLVQEVIKKDNPSFSFINGEHYQFDATLEKNAEEDKLIQQIKQWCRAKNCDNKINFLETIKEAKWSNKTQNIVNFLIENQVKNGSITIKDNHLHIRGELKEEKKRELQELLENFDSSIQIQSDITLTATVLKIEEVKKELTQDEKPKATITEPIKEAQSKINTLLKDTVINFQLNSSKILPSSQKVLDHIIEIINNLKIETKLNISGHTDARGSANYNKRLSQKRANSVKNYLLKHNIHSSKLTSIGYGEEKLIFAPEDKRNRRVEITLTKGK